ncbi:MAG: SpoIIE family protein phosphatase [Chlamydiae bacterium]|nr:SpoIIE family protein phosphatase [Chlamydiota bacterium]
MPSSEKSLLQQIQKLYGVIEASTLVISELDINEVLRLVMEIAKKVVNAEASSLLVLDAKTGLLGYEVALGEKGEEVKQKFSLKLGQGIAGWVAEHGKPLLVEDAQKDERFFKGADQSTGFKTRSILCVPMKVHDKITGVIEVINPLKGKKAFDEGDLKLLNAFSSLAAIAIENAKLTQEKLEQQAMEQSLVISHQIQENFLKKDFPNLKSFQAFAQLKSAYEIGGDFYDFLALGKNRWGIVIGDVSGRGIPAALYMMRTLSEFRLEAFSDLGPAEILEELNDRLVKRAAFGMFVTLSYFVLDCKTGKLEWANAGHLPFFICRARSGKVEKILGEHGLPLGILYHSKIPLQEVMLEKGDLLILLTDGVIEARNAKGEEFGWERLEKYLESLSPEASLEQTVNDLFEKLDRFGGSFAIPDDVTLLALKYHGPQK